MNPPLLRTDVDNNTQLLDVHPKLHNDANAQINKLTATKADKAYVDAQDAAIRAEIEEAAEAETARNIYTSPNGTQWLLFSGVDNMGRPIVSVYSGGTPDTGYTNSFAGENGTDYLITEDSLYYIAQEA